VPSGTARRRAAPRDTVPYGATQHRNATLLQLLSVGDVWFEADVATALFAVRISLRRIPIYRPTADCDVAYPPPQCVHTNFSL